MPYPGRCLGLASAAPLGLMKFCGVAAEELGAPYANPEFSSHVSAISAWPAALGCTPSPAQ